MSTASQGHDFTGWFLHEDNGFSSSPNDTDHKPFGADATFDSAEGSNNAQQVFAPGSRAPIDIVEQVFQGSWSVSFSYTNPWWLNWFFGSPSQTDNNDGSYTYDWSGEEPQSHQIGIGRTDSGKERVLMGCIATEASISPSVGGMAEVTLRGAYADEKVVDPASITSQPSINEKPMTFADAALKLGGTTLGYVQSGTVTIQNNIQLIQEWGQRPAIDFSPRSLTPTVSFSKINEAGEVDNLKKMYGSSASSSVQDDVTNEEAMTLVLDNGNSAGSGINKLTVNLTGTFPDSYSESGLGDPEADVTEDINRLVEGITVDATNEVASAR